MVRSGSRPTRGPTGWRGSRAPHGGEGGHNLEEREGCRKPVFDEGPAAVGMELLPLTAGQMVMFHDELLHGGVVNRGTSCRVSIELTVLFDKADALRRAEGLRGELAAA